MDRVSLVVIETRYDFDGPGIKSRWGWNIPHLLDRRWGSPGLLYNGYRVISGDKAADTWRWPPTPISAEVKERVEL